MSEFWKVITEILVRAIHLIFQVFNLNIDFPKNPNLIAESQTSGKIKYIFYCGPNPLL